MFGSLGPHIANVLGKFDNAIWILDKMIKDYKIYDIGIDMERANRSSSYFMEQLLTFFYKYKEIVIEIITK